MYRVTIRVNYPLEWGTMVLRTDNNWDEDLHPYAVDGDHNRFEFSVETDKPFIHFKPCVRNGDELIWAEGMNKLAISLPFLIVFSINISSQVVTDAVRYSLLDVGGTARSVGIGGAIGALGADFSVLSTNPAGAAAYRRSEFTFTPALDISSVDALLTVNDNSTVKRIIKQ